MTTTDYTKYDANASILRAWLDEVLPKGKPELAGSFEDRKAYFELSGLHTQELISLGNEMKRQLVRLI